MDDHQHNVTHASFGTCRGFATHSVTGISFASSRLPFGPDPLCLLQHRILHSSLFILPDESSQRLFHICLYLYSEDAPNRLRKLHRKEIFQWEIFGRVGQGLLRVNEGSAYPISTGGGIE